MKRVVVICGPTASGKSSLALQIAEQHNGEIICADSRTIYKGMDIGTAKPTPAERRKIRHHLLDIREPGETFSAHSFQSAAKHCIETIQRRGKLPIVVGGTGLYIDALIYDYTFTSGHDSAQRAIFEKMSLEQLYKYSKENNVTLPENYKNKRYVVRNIERNGQVGQRKMKLDPQFIVVGITTEKNILKQRIVQRIEHMLQHGVVHEAIMLGEKYGWDNAAMQSNIYGVIKEAAINRWPTQYLIERAAARDWQLAKKQQTWLKRNKDIVWQEPDAALHYAAKRLE
jgi:tRNA dimethylallyltransferase